MKDMKKFLLIIFMLLSSVAFSQNIITLPTTGAATPNPAGNSVLIYDNGNLTGTYSNNASGSVYLTAMPGQSITISGSIWTENGFDFFNIFNGNTTIGAPLVNISGKNYWYTYTGAPGQGLTIQLTSDGNIRRDGLYLLITYSSTTQLNIPATGNTTITCGNNRTLFDSGGRPLVSGNYTINNNGYVVFNCASLSQITLLGVYDSEYGYDEIRIFSGTGLGGTLLATYTGDFDYVYPSFNYTGTSGQTLTVQFISDNSINYTGFEIAVKYSGVCSALPVELTDFTATCNDNMVDLKWTTASEQNSDKFIIEKTRDLENWVRVDSLDAAGSSSTEIKYQYNDVNVYGLETIYYRLNQIDFNGENKIYGPISVECLSNENIVTVSPNPNPGSFNLQINAVENIGMTDLYICDLTGKIVWNRRYDIKAGTTYFSINLDLENGIYFVKSNSSKLKTVKFVIAK